MENEGTGTHKHRLGLEAEEMVGDIISFLRNGHFLSPNQVTKALKRHLGQLEVEYGNQFRDRSLKAYNQMVEEVEKYAKESPARKADQG